MRSTKLKEVCGPPTSLVAVSMVAVKAVEAITRTSMLRRQARWRRRTRSSSCGWLPSRGASHSGCTSHWTGILMRGHYGSPNSDDRFLPVA